MRNKKHRLQGQSRKGRREQTGTDRDRQGQTKKPKAEAEEDGGGQMGQRTEKNGENAGNTGNTGNTGNAGNRRWKQKRQEMYTGNAQYKKKKPRNRFRSLLSSVPRRQGQPPGYYPIRRAAPQGFRPEPVPESRPGASWRAPRSQGHAPEVPWRPSKFRCCSLRRAPCPWRA